MGNIVFVKQIVSVNIEDEMGFPNINLPTNSQIHQSKAFGISFKAADFFFIKRI